MDGDDFMMDQQAKFDDDFEEEIYDEERYDALNEETFGNDMSVGDWEVDHENYAIFDENIKHRTEMNDYINDEIPTKTNVFSESLKSLPDLERELRLLHTSTTNQYENPLPLQYLNSFNYVNQNLDINLPNSHCDPIRRSITSVQNHISSPQNMFNMPPGFNETNGYIDDVSTTFPSKELTSAISVADLERSLINAVKISPFNNSVPEVQGVLHMPSLYKTDLSQYTPNVHNISKNFPRNNTARNVMNVKTFNNMNNYALDEQSDIDHGAGFMTVREKHWLAGIQTIQFHSGSPLDEDFYFTMYQKRHFGPKTYNMFSSSQKSETQTKVNSSYTPLHFENSLGKVLVGNVITPKRTIDIEKNDFPQSTSTATNSLILPHKNAKQILLEIEHMYVPLLKIEQTYYSVRNKIQAAPIVQTHIDELTNILKTHSHYIGSYVTIRKGKQLIHRILPHLKNPSFLWSEFFGPSICTIITKDTEDQLLLLFLPYIRQWIFCLCLGELNQIAKYLMKNLSFVLLSIFGISIIANMIERAEEIRPITEPYILKEWSMFISNVIYIGSETLIQKPVIGLDKKIIDTHLSNLLFDKPITSEKKKNLVQRLSFFVTPVKNKK